jgi:hypothetical protein
MSAKERIAGDITEGATFLKRGKDITSNAKVSDNSLEQALSKAKIEWVENE